MRVAMLKRIFQLESFRQMCYERQLIYPMRIIKFSSFPL